MTHCAVEKGPDEGKVFNLVRGLQKEIDDEANTAAVLQPLKDRAERILKDLEDRKITGLAAMDILAALAAANISALEFAREVETLTCKFPNAAVNDDEQRVLRANLYKPLLALGKEDRTRLVDLIIATLFP